MTDLEKQLAEDHLELVPLMVSALTRSCPNLSGDESEELAQIGYLALCRAAMSHDHNRPFEPYAKAAIRHAIYDYWRDCRRRNKRFCSLDALMEKDIDPTAFQHPDFPSGTSKDVEDAAYSGEYFAFLRLLEQQSSGVLQKGMIALQMQQQGYKSTDLAKIYNVPPNHIRAWQSKARKVLKENEELYALLA